MADVSHFDPDGVVHERGVSGRTDDIATKRTARANGIHPPHPPPLFRSQRHNEPFNAEPNIRKLTSSPITEQRELYRRNHDDIVYAEPGVKATEEEWALDVVVDMEVAEQLGWERWMPATTAASTSSDSQKDGAPAHSTADISPESRTLSLPLPQLKSSYPPRSVLSAMECAGNRRSEMNARSNKPASPEGLQWKQGAIGNAKWTGASLREVLLDLGVPDPYAELDEEERQGLEPSEKVMQTRSAEWSRGTYVHFLSSQPSSEADPSTTSPAAQVYGSSLPLSTAMHPNQSVLLCYSVNSQPLGPAHGYPLRVVIPGYVAARWVKWLRGLRITAQENDSPPMKDDYKILSPPSDVSGEEEQRKWVEELSGEKMCKEKRMKALRSLPPLMTLGVGSGVSEPQESEEGKESVVKLDAEGRWTAKGYAVGTEGSPVALVELLLLPDKGDSSSSLESLRQRASETPGSQWVRLPLEPPSSDASSSPNSSASPRFSWSWSLWTAHLDAPPSGYGAGERWALVVRCTTSSSVRQEMQSPWNVRGFKERSWPVVRGLTFQRAET